MRREIAGISCAEVLARLVDVLDDDLDDRDRTRIAAHVAACSACERFGARYAAVVRALHAGDVPPEVAAALAARLRAR